MMHCSRHNIWYQGSKCQRCINKLPPYRYSRDEVADPNEWARFRRLGWTL